MGSNRYSELLKPTEVELEKVYEDFQELKAVLKDDSTKEEGLAYCLKGNKYLEKLYKLLKSYNIKHPNPNLKKNIDKSKGSGEYDESEELDVKITALKVGLSDGNRKLRQREVIKDKYWKNHKNKPNNVYGIDKFDKSFRIKYFNRGHLIADSILEYSCEFNNYSWENFVMITDWCNRANTEKNGNKAFGMFYFEKKILKVLDDGKTDDGKILKDEEEIKYKVTPVFKETYKGVYEVIPRGIIIEAGIGLKKENAYSNELFIVFIPNAQKGLEINYATGKVIKI